MNQSASDVSSTRPVLIWHPDNDDDSRVLPDLAQAAKFLETSPEAVTAAIASGELVNGRFVDWEA